MASPRQPERDDDGNGSPEAANASGASNRPGASGEQPAHGRAGPTPPGARRSGDVGPNPLELDAETMRRLGYRVVDLLVDRIAGLEAGPVWRGASRAEMRERLAEPPPAEPEPFEELLERLSSDVAEFAGRVDHPRFFAFVPSCPTWPAMLGDFLAAGHNIFQGTWLESAGPSEVELVVLDWFKRWIGYPDDAAGVLVSGGSAANLTALVCAREALLEPGADAVIYLSDQVHSSVERAARIIGFRPEQVRTLPTESDYRLSPATLRAAIRDDRQAGRHPFLAVANGGATSTGAVDPLDELAATAQSEGVWLHVDAAYGGYAILTDRGQERLAGIERADSVTLDPHKWLYQPFEAGCLLVRNGRLLPDAFHIMPDYLQDTATDDESVPEWLRGGVNFADRGLQLTRSARALKIWLSLKYFGVDAYRVAIDRCMDLAVAAQRRIEESPDLELLSAAELGIVCFRRVPAAVAERATAGAEVAEAEIEALNKTLVRRLNESGLGMISSTRLDGRYALRFCILSHRTTVRDVERVLEWLQREPVEAGIR